MSLHIKFNILTRNACDFILDMKYMISNKTQHNTQDKKIREFLLNYTFH